MWKKRKFHWFFHWSRKIEMWNAIKKWFRNHIFFQFSVPNSIESFHSNDWISLFIKLFMRPIIKSTKTQTRRYDLSFVYYSEWHILFSKHIHKIFIYIWVYDHAHIGLQCFSIVGVVSKRNHTHTWAVHWHNNRRNFATHTPSCIHNITQAQHTTYITHTHTHIYEYTVAAASSSSLYFIFKQN